MSRDLKFTVIIPAYNGAPTISRAIRSVRAQSYPACEVIVVDDASTDDTVSVVESEFPGKVRIVKKITNQGSSAARNAGMDIATGDYIAFLDADDIWHPNKLEVANTICGGNLSIHLFFHPFTQRDITTISLPENMTLYKLPFIKLLRENMIATSCAIIKNDPTFRFEPTMRYTEDYDLWLRIGYKYKIYFINTPLTQIFRGFTTPGGISSNRWKMRKGEMRAYTRLLKLNPLFTPLLPILLLSSAGKHLYKKFSNYHIKPWWKVD